MTEGENETGYRLGRWIAHQDWPLWVLFVAALGLALLAYPTLPDRFPIHWNLRGEADNWGSRGFGVFGLLSLCVGIYLLMLVAPIVDPKRANYPKFLPTYRVVRWSVVILFLGIWSAALAAARGITVPIDRLVPALLSLLFVVIGNVIGRIRYNWFVGIRTPWALSSEEAWRLTHRAAGPAFVLGGLLSLIGALLGGVYALASILLGVGGAAVFSVIYSYFAFKRVSRSSGG